MKLFGRRKKKKQREEEQILADFLGTNDAFVDEFTKRQDEPEQIEHYVLDKCEQIIENAKEVEEKKEEYYDVMRYLNDLAKLESLPEYQREAIVTNAKQVENLSKSKQQYLTRSKKLNDTQFEQMRQFEREIPDTINRLKANEARQSTVKRDMGYLEGEKTEWKSERTKMIREQEQLKGASMLVFSLSALLCVFFLVLQSYFNLEMMVPFMVLICVAAALGIFIFIRMQQDGARIKKAETNMNYAITLLNKVKIKYVNATNAVEYTCEKFHVKNSFELNYQWEKYMEALREQDTYQQTSEDLEIYQKRLEKKIRDCNLNEPDSWAMKPSLFLDRTEFELVRSELEHRRQKLYSQMEYNTQVIRTSRDEIERLLKRNKTHSKELKEILESVDQLCKI